MDDKTEFDRAQEWRIRNELTIARLAEAIGYSPEALYLFERRSSAPQPTGRPRQLPDPEIKPWVWLRYKRACGDLDAELNGRKKGKVFSW